MTPTVAMVILTGHIFCGELNIQVKLIWKEKLKQKSCEPKKVNLIQRQWTKSKKNVPQGHHESKCCC